MKEITSHSEGLRPEPERREEDEPKPAAASGNPVQSPQPVKQSQEQPQASDDVSTRKLSGQDQTNAEVLALSRRHTRRSFIAAAAATAAGYGFYEWLSLGQRENMQPVALEKAYEFNAALARHNTLEWNLAPTYPLKRAETLRVNGVVGLKKELEMDSYRLQLVGMADSREHPKYTEDVTAWRYRYSGKTDMEDRGHDSKTPPSAGKSTSAGAPRAAAGKPRRVGNEGGYKVSPKSDTALSMAPESMIQKAEDHQIGSKTAEEQDDNHSGRAARGQGEAGESFTTLRPGTAGLLLTMADIRSCLVMNW